MNNDITVCVNNVTSRPEAAVAACEYAAKFNGTVTAAYIKLDEVEIRRWQSASPMEFANQLLADLDAREAEAKASFDKLASNHNCTSVWRTIAQSQEPIQQLLCTDVIFCNQPSEEDERYPNHQSFLNHLILETKRPIIMIPKGWNEPFRTSKIIFGWNSSAEAMRAVSDALPFIQGCEQLLIVDILTQRMIKRERNVLYHIQDYFTRKNIEHQLTIEHCDKTSDIPTTLIERAASEGSDLIVVGGYGHSRIKEIILGGVTDYLIKHATLPVLFSH